MNNPYIVLDISQDATNVDIVKAQVKALRLKNIVLEKSQLHRKNFIVLHAA